MDQHMFNYSLEDVIGERFGRYSKYIIQERALPDVRDGLKPVQRRILYAMYVDGNTSTKSYRKSAKTVGYVIANYHPHGDTSVYDAMVRMSQWWKQRVTLIDMHGNNGSLDDDPAAAMRYTEARLSSISEELLRDIEKETVPFALNFDDTTEEPTVLPARFPNILVNGAKGIAVGMATFIPPHNLVEVVAATIYRIHHPDCTVDELMKYLPGPDLPTGGIIHGNEGIKQAFTTGSGQFQIEARTHFIEQKNHIDIVITEIPFDIIKSEMVSKLDAIRIDHSIDGILEVRDETDREGLRIVIEIHKEADRYAILNYLMKKTDLTCKYNYNMVAICGKKPRLSSLPQILDDYIDHQKNVIYKRCEFDRRKAQERLHLVEGLIIAVSRLDEVIRLIRASKDKSDAKKQLIDAFEMDEIQAEAIVMLQLYRLSSTDILALQNEKKQLTTLIRFLTQIIENSEKLNQVVVDELQDIVKRFNSPRISEIGEDEMIDYKVEEKKLFTKEDVYVVVSRDGYFKRTSVKSYNSSQNQGNGNSEPGCKNGDMIIASGLANTNDTLLAFTDKANYLFIPVYELSDIKWKDEGKHISNLVSLSGEEKIIQVILVKDFEHHLSSAYQAIHIAMCSRSGKIKRTVLSDYDVKRYSKSFSCMNLDQKDGLVGVEICDGDTMFCVISKQGKMSYYHENEVSIIGVKANGVNAIKLDNNDEVAIFRAQEHSKTTNYLLITNQGGYKVVSPLGFVSTKRLIKPFELFKYYRSEPHLAVAFLDYDDKNPTTYKMLTSLENRIPVDISISSKATPIGKGIRNSMKLEKGEKIICVYGTNLPTITPDFKRYEPKEKPAAIQPANEADDVTPLTIFDVIDDL